ncbi:MAG: hypothetical protein ABIM74_02065 [candidate division WOR-3 bacterium]
MRLFLTTLLIAVPLAAQRVAVASFQAVGLDEATARATTELAGGALASEGYSVVEAEGLSDADRYNALIRAEEAGAEMLFTGSLTRMGRNIVLWCSLLRTDGSVVYQDKLILGSEDEISEGLEAIVKATRTGQKARVVLEERRLSEKGITGAKSSYVTTGLTMGSVIPFAGLSEKNPLNGGSISANFEIPKGTFQLGTGLYVSEDALLWNIAGLKANYIPMGISDFSPYIGMGAGFAVLNSWAGDTVENTHGWIFEPGFGMIFFRTYEVRLVVDVRYAFLLGRENPNGLVPSIGFSYQTGGF